MSSPTGKGKRLSIMHAESERANVIAPQSNADGGFARGQDKVVDHSNAIRVFRKPAGSKESKMNISTVFAGPTSEQRQTRKSGAALHSDPFASDRPHHQPVVKRLIQPNLAPPHVQARRHIDDPEHQTTKAEFISGNGVVFRGGKVIKPAVTTMNDEPKKVDYAALARFRTEGAPRDLRTGPSDEETPYRRGEENLHLLPPQKKRNVAQCNQESLTGVMMGLPLEKRQFKYRPPWAISSTSPRPGSAPMAKKTNKVPMTPWAVGGNLS